MAVRLACPHCRRKIAAPEQYRGQERKCPHCGGNIRVPFVDADSKSKHSDSSHGHHDPLTTTRPKQAVHDLIDMTAMVDIVFFLLIFFLVTSFVSLSAAIQAPSVNAKLGKTARDPDKDTNSVQPLVVRIDADDVIWIDQEPAHGLHDLIVRLRSAKDDTQADGLRIEASPDATHGKVVMLLDAAVSAGFKEAQLTVSESP